MVMHEGEKRVALVEVEKQLSWALSNCQFTRTLVKLTLVLFYNLTRFGYKFFLLQMWAEAGSVKPSRFEVTKCSDL